MMSKRRWFVVLCLFIVYLLVGTAIFFTIESVEEEKRIEVARQERLHISELLRHHMSPDTKEQVFKELSDYCGKTIHVDMSNVKDEHHWDFYHTFFFVVTVVSTIGYGNLAPTIMTTRIIMIFYGLIGIPMNGIVMVTLGGYFGKSFSKLYERWKNVKMQKDTARLGLISQIILYLVPGFTFFIFLPSVIMVIFEGWAYDEAVYYCFVTLTTIGFGDYVAGVHNENGFSPLYYSIYKIFLLVWVIGGLGYVVMVLGFITQGLQSKRLKQLEHVLTTNIKRTPVKIRQELRSILQEFLFLRVRRVYKDEFHYVPSKIVRSQSCPDLTIYRNMNSPTQRRKRALSECPRNFVLNRIQSDTDLELIDKERTFKPAAALMQQKDLLLKVVDALGNFETEALPQKGVDMFSDNEILASEKYGSTISLEHEEKSSNKRQRAFSDIRPPKNEHTWYGQDADNYYQQFRQRALSDPAEKSPQINLFTKIKKKITLQKDDKFVDIEKQEFPMPPKRRSQSIFVDRTQYMEQTAGGRPSILSLENEHVLEQTSIADFLRALSAVTDNDDEYTESSARPQRKLGNAGITPPRSPLRSRRLAIRPPHIRRGSLMPTPNVPSRVGRRFSLRPVDEQALAPPPYTPAPLNVPPAPQRRFSRTSNVPPSLAFPSPVQKQLHKRDKEP